MWTFEGKIVDRRKIPTRVWVKIILLIYVTVSFERHARKEKRFADIWFELKYPFELYASRVIHVLLVHNILERFENYK